MTARSALFFLAPAIGTAVLLAGCAAPNSSDDTPSSASAIEAADSCRGLYLAGEQGATVDLASELASAVAPELVKADGSVSVPGVVTTSPNNPGLSLSRWQGLSASSDGHGVTVGFNVSPYNHDPDLMRVGVAFFEAMTRATEKVVLDFQGNPHTWERTSANGLISCSKSRVDGGQYDCRVSHVGFATQSCP